MMRDQGPDPSDTVKIIDQLVSMGVMNNEKFKKMHHLGGSLHGFRTWCQEKVRSFQPNGNNRKLHEQLQKMLDQYLEKSS